MNLTWEVRDGILNHTGPNERADARGPDRADRRPRRLHQPRHRRRGPRRAAGARTICRATEIELLGETGSRRIDTLVHDLVETSAAAGDIRQSDEIGAAMLALRSFMFERVYLGEGSQAEHRRAAETVERIFDHLRAHPEALPPGEGELAQRITDFVAGMTDRYALSYAAALYVARIKDTSVDAVRAAIDMVELVGGRTQLRKAGARYTGRCPFHEERTPSFSVNAVDKLYYCFGCGAKGDAITFVRETENLDFAGAIEWLGERFRVELEYEDESPRQDAERRRRERLLALLEQATALLRALPLGHARPASRCARTSPAAGSGKTSAASSGSGSRRGARCSSRRRGRRGSRRRSCGRRAGRAARRRLLLGAAAVPARRRARPRRRLPGAPAAATTTR